MAPLAHGTSLAGLHSLACLFGCAGCDDLGPRATRLNDGKPAVQPGSTATASASGLPDA